MNGQRHLVIGIGCGLALASVVPTPELRGVVIGLTAVSSLLPDLDHEGALASRIPIIGQLSSIVVRFLSNALSVVQPVINPYPGNGAGHHLTHRGPFHAPIMVVVLYYGSIALGLTPILALAIAVGYACHLVSDAPTLLGLPLLWPILGRMYHVTPRLIRFRSGHGLIEWPIALAVLGLGIKFWL